MRGVIDRIEGKIAICEIDKNMTELDLSLFSSTPKDGDVFEYDGKTAVVLKDETEKKKQQVQSLFDKLKKK